MALPTKPLPPRMQTLEMSMSGNVGGDRQAGRVGGAAAHRAEELVQGGGLAREPVVVEPGVGEDFLHVVARLPERDGLGVDRAFERAFVVPAVRASGAGVVSRRGEQRLAERGEHAAEI